MYNKKIKICILPPGCIQAFYPFLPLDNTAYSLVNVLAAKQGGF
jgi:hypothetical protein